MACHNRKVHVTLKGQPLAKPSLPQVFHNKEDYCDDNRSEVNIQNRLESNSEISDLESDDSSSIIIESDSEYSPGVIIDSGSSEYSLSESSSTENEINENDEDDFVMAQSYLQNEVQIKRRLQRKYLWYSRTLNK